MREQPGEFRLTATCRVRGVNRSGYYAWAGNSAGGIGVNALGMSADKPSACFRSALMLGLVKSVAKHCFA